MKLKCIKCGLFFKDRKDTEDSEADKSLCWNCRFVWRIIGIVLKAIPPKINRTVAIRLEDVYIKKTGKKM